MTPPIFVICENGDLLMFASAKEACAYAESPDVESGEYPAAYDAEGHRLVLEVLEPTRVHRGWFVESIQLTPVTIRAVSETPDGIDELRRVLMDKLANHTADVSLVDLVTEAQRALTFM